MDTDIILTKLDSLRRCITRIEDKTPASADILKGDYDLQDIISINLERAVQISVDVASRILSQTETSTPATMGETFIALSEIDVISGELAVQLRKSVGFRNISVHEYEKVDWEIVYSICTRRIDTFRMYTAAVLKFFDIT